MLIFGKTKTRKPKQRRPRTPDEQAVALNEARATADAWKRKYDEAAASLGVLAAALPASLAARDQAVAQAAVNAAAPRLAQSTVDALADHGYLRQKPAETALVKHVVRDGSGQITGMFERMEQLDTGGDPPEAA